MKSTKQRSIPTSRLSRFGKLGSLASGVAANMLVDGVKQLTQGNSVTLKDLMLQPKNINQLADKLSQLRGAAMKMGQLLSMDAGEILPPELADLLAKLRSEANHMPHKQLLAVVKENYGNDWLDSFSHFELTPFAAASIGQVHEAYAINGDKLAVKVQYPGISDSIGSDVDNVATLLKISQLLPKQINLDELLSEAKKQLHIEADYQQEADFLQRYQRHLQDSDDFIIPKLYPQLSTNRCLAMAFMNGMAIDACVDLPQAQRDFICEKLIALFLQELFDFKLLQSDPNFANYLFQVDCNKIVLLDFGASRDIPRHISQGYQALLSGAVLANTEQMFAAAQQIGFFDGHVGEKQKQHIIDIFKVATEPLRFVGEFDFGETQIAAEIKDASLKMNLQKDEWHTPPVDALYVHRKLGGLYMLASKLKAKVNANRLFQPYLISP